ncbi:hypothetical protein [Paraburkholderia sp. D1E]|uniref:hypothetical protein n=1 Tax=Paraburkholderia sp. D1E TaxID=3461398 RepID=UPI0040457F08
MHSKALIDLNFLTNFVSMDMQQNRTEADSRFKKMAKNAQVSLFFLVLVLVATFVSRAVFIHKIGANFIGLATTIVNIVGFLNLAEMGFASVVAFALYGPIMTKIDPRFRLL